MNFSIAHQSSHSKTSWGIMRGWWGWLIRTFFMSFLTELSWTNWSFSLQITMATVLLLKLICDNNSLPQETPFEIWWVQVSVRGEQAWNRLKSNRSDMVRRHAAESPSRDSTPGCRVLLRGWKKKTGRDMSSHCETVTGRQGLVNTAQSHKERSKWCVVNSWHQVLFKL